MNRKADFLLFESIRITNRIDSNRELECSTVEASGSNVVQHVFSGLALGFGEFCGLVREPASLTARHCINCSVSLCNIGHQAYYSP